MSLFIGLSLMVISYDAFPTTNISFLHNNTIEFKNSMYVSYEQGIKKLVFKSKKGNINLENQDINLIGDVKGQFILDGETFTLIAKSLNGNLVNKSISSKDNTVFKANDMEIVSTSMKIFQTPQEGVKIIFKNANLDKIHSGSKINKGRANKIELFPEKGLVFMEGSAEFYQDNMKIITEEIHYDLNQDRILKSINAKIINNL